MGDVILKYDGQAITSPRRLTKLVRGTEPESEVDIRVLRKGQEKSFRIKLGELEGRKHCRMRIFDGEDGDELFMDIDEDALLLGLPPLSGLLMTKGLWLGVQPIELSDQLADYFRVTDGGVLIGEVFEDSPAEKAGLKAGDVIVALGGEDIEDTMELREEIGEHDEGDEVTVAVMRDGRKKSFQATLEESPEKDRLAVTRKLEKWPHKMHKLHIGAPDEDMVDIYLEKELDEDELEELEERLEKLEETLEELQEKLEKK
jgi:C-terminal processing protease CtpA/Prc